MKWGFRKPSLRKRVASRLSWKRYVRHSLGLKAPRGWGWLTNPHKALYNRIYRRTTFGLGDLLKLRRRSASSSHVRPPREWRSVIPRDPVGMYDTPALAAARQRRAELALEVKAERNSYLKTVLASVGVGAKYRYYRTAQWLRFAAERLIGWRLGVVVIYLAIIAIAVFFAEIVLAAGWLTAWLGLVDGAAIIALHYAPSDALIPARQQRAGEARRLLVATKAHQRAQLKRLKQEVHQLDHSLAAANGGVAMETTIPAGCASVLHWKR